MVLVEQEKQVYYQPSFLWLMTGDRRLEDITKSISNLRAAGVDVIIDRVTGIDAERRRLRLQADTLPYDILIIAAGADADKPDCPELDRAGHNLYTPDGALEINRAVEDFERGHVVFLAESLPFKCPPALYEAALMLRSYFARRGRMRGIYLSVFTPELKPLSAAGDRPARAITKALAAQGISLYTGQHVESVNPGKRYVRFSGGEDTHYDLLIYVAAHRAPEAVRKSGLADESGWVPADPYTLRTAATDVYAIGDVNRVRLPSGDDLFKSGEFAHFQGLVVAENVAAQILGRAPKRLFGGKMGCVIDTGNSALTVIGNIYRRRPNLLVLPASRAWRAGKLLAEWQWLREHG